MKGKVIVADFRSKVEVVSPNATKAIQFIAAEAQMKMFEISGRATGCQCECLGMNAQDSRFVSMGQAPKYSDKDYFKVMEKWGLISETRKPLI